MLINIYEEGYKAISPADIIDYTLKNGTNTQFNVNGSVTPQLFRYDVPINKQLELSYIQFGLTATSAVSSTTDFMNISGGLTNGLSIIADGVEIINWKNNRDINLSVEDMLAPLIFARQDRQINGKLSVPLHFGRKILISSYIAFKVSDNLSTLTGAISKVQGILR